MHPVGFEPTSTNTFELESNPLDRSGKNAHPTSEINPSPTILLTGFFNTQYCMSSKVLLRFGLRLPESEPDVITTYTMGPYPELLCRPETNFTPVYPQLFNLQHPHRKRSTAPLVCNPLY